MNGDDHNGTPNGWSLCLATYQRGESLEFCIQCALRQTVPPREIIVADSGPDWEENRDRVERLLDNGSEGTQLCYIRSDVQSTCYQRNRAIQKATSDIIFILDDDSFMDERCAEAILAMYADDTDAKIAAIAISNLTAPPGATVASTQQKVGALGSATDKKARLKRALPKPVVRLIYDVLLLLPMHRQFIPYDGSYRIASQSEIDALGITDAIGIPLLEGCRTTVRREVAQRELFEENFLRYGPGGDINCTYRFSRHGMLLMNSRARLYHYEAAPNRFKRKLLRTLQLTNVAYGIKTRSSRLMRDIPRYYLLFTRMSVACGLRDLISGRFTFPEVRGAAVALPISMRLFAKKEDRVAEWYRNVQTRLFET